MLYEPAASDTDWLMLPVPLRKATCVPSGALGLSTVKLLPLLLTPAPPKNCQDKPGGVSSYVPAATASVSKLLSAMALIVEMETSSMRAVLSPPTGSRPTNAIVCGPAATVNVDDW